MRLFKSKRQKRAEALESFIWYLYGMLTSHEVGSAERMAIIRAADLLWADVDKLMPEWADADD